jgi:hypothetical protein
LQLRPPEQLLWDLGRAIAKNPHGIDEKIYGDLAKKFDEKQTIQLLAFAGMMVATNLFVTIVKVDLDEVLYPFKKEGQKNG